MLALQAGPQAEGHAAAAARGEILTGPAPGIKNKTLFGDFIVSQVKVFFNFSLLLTPQTMSLLAFLLRNPNETLKTFKNVIPEYVVRLLKDCPPELSSARKVFPGSLRS